MLASLPNDAKRAVVMSFLSWSGSMNSELPYGLWSKVYLKGDGFGPHVGPEYASQVLEWDWSHVRDSSPAAIDAMFAELADGVGVEAVAMALGKSLVALEKIIDEKNSVMRGVIGDLSVSGGVL